MAPFKDMFSAPSTPNTLYGSGQSFTIDVPSGARAVVTDVYVENHGNSDGRLVLSERHSESSYEIRYVFRVRAGETALLNFSTGLRFGELGTDVSEVLVGVEDVSLLPRLNGYFE